VAEALWRRLLENVEGEMDSSGLRVWFESVTAVALESDSLTLSVPNPFAKEYIETRFEATLQAALREELSERAVLRVVVGGVREG
jgi:chromosomal replication initiator protein